jgi:predicted phage terminase large subunit-like protein
VLQSAERNPWERQIISVDATFKSLEAAKGKDPDFVVISVWGTRKADRYLLHLWRKQAGFAETCAAIREIRDLYPRAHKVLIEDKANGSAIIETLQGEISGVIGVNPEGGKESRANAVAPQVESGNVYLPEGAGWLDTFVGELAGFPRARHDDCVDSMSQALLDLTPSGGANRIRMMVSG